MSPKEMLQGKWLGHPLHPALVHVPSGLWPAALLFDVLTHTGGGSNVAYRVAFGCVAVGLAAALAAAPTGLADWWEIKAGKPAHRLGIVHMSINVAVAMLMAGSLLFRMRQGLDAHSTAPPALGLCAGANVLLIVSGYIGGRMVFEHGVSIARMSKRQRRQIALEGKAKLPPEEGSS